MHTPLYFKGGLGAARAAIPEGFCLVWLFSSPIFSWLHERATCSPIRDAFDSKQKFDLHGSTTELV